MRAVMCILIVKFSETVMLPYWDTIAGVEITNPLPLPLSYETI